MPPKSKRPSWTHEDGVAILCDPPFTARVFLFPPPYGRPLVFRGVVHLGMMHALQDETTRGEAMRYCRRIIRFTRQALEKFSNEEKP